MVCRSSCERIHELDSLRGAVRRIHGGEKEFGPFDDGY